MKKNVTLDDFIVRNRDEILLRCRARVARRSHPPATEAEIDRGIPLFLAQLVEEMRCGPSKTNEINRGAARHGHDLLFQGFSISEVVHDYGAVCQSITDLAVELGASISTDSFRTMNRCLDDAIAGAVSEYAREQDVPQGGESRQLQNLTNAALIAFEALQMGHVGVGGSTAALVRNNLMALHAALICRSGLPLGPPLDLGAGLRVGVDAD
jgi:hypothetical protein